MVGSQAVVGPHLDAVASHASSRYCVRAYRTALRVQGAMARPLGQLLLQRTLVASGVFGCEIAAFDSDMNGSDSDIHRNSRMKDSDSKLVNEFDS